MSWYRKYPQFIYPLAPLPVIQVVGDGVHLALPPCFVLNTNGNPAPGQYMEVGAAGIGTELPQESLRDHITTLSAYTDVAPVGTHVNSFQSIGFGSRAFPFVAAPAEPLVQLQAPGGDMGRVRLYTAKGDGVTAGVLVDIKASVQYSHYRLKITPTQTGRPGKIEVFENGVLIYTQSTVSAQPDFTILYTYQLVLAQYTGTGAAAGAYSSFSNLMLEQVPYNSPLGI